MIALLVVTDGRLDYLERTIDSAGRQLRGPISERWMYDDSGDADHRALLRRLYPQFRHFDAGPRQGFAGAIQAAWARLLASSAASFVFHLEQDFVFPEPVHLAELAELLMAQPHLAQVALRRQAWNATEKAAGGFIEAAPGWYQEQESGPHTWVETARNFTTNPSLYRFALMMAGWPDAPESEGKFGFQLRDRGLPWGIPGDLVRFGFAGSLVSGRERTLHIGDHRVGTGY